MSDKAGMPIAEVKRRESIEGPRRPGKMLRFSKYALAVSLTSLLSVGAELDMHSAHMPENTADELDFTKLTLEQLLETEITPINVLGSHTHIKGELMFGYRYSLQQYNGNLSGTRQAGAQEVLAQYPVHHTGMTMEMHMFEVMYAPTDKLTIMGMSEYMEMSMDHLRRNGTTFTSEVGGVGDTELMGLYNILGNPRGGAHRLAINAGVSLPTGSIDERFGGEQLEYSMQLGSGTFDLIPGLTYLGESESFSWGAQALGRLRLGENSRDYRLGDAYQLDAWGYYKLRDWFGPSLRMEWKQWGNIHGADPELDPMHNPAFDARSQRGRRLDLLGGLNFYVSKGPLKGLRLSTEAGAPVYQNIAGPNLGLDWLVNVGVSYVFH